MFTHLHLHTEFSLLDGLSRIPKLLDHVQELGQEACAITDHGALYGVVDFYKEARSRDLKPIIGVEAYTTRGKRTSRDPKDKSPYHLTLLARNQKGYSNLLQLVTKAHLEGYYYKPRMDRELLEQYGEGIIALSGCNSGEIHRLLMDGRRDDAIEQANWSREVFDGYYFEMMENGLPDVTAVNKQLVELSRELEIPLVATVDSHYIRPEDAPDHDVLLCIGTNATVMDEKRMKMNAPVYYIQSEAEVRARFAELPEAVDNTQQIAEACDVTLEFGRLHLPDPDLPPGVSAEEHLANLAHSGLQRRYDPVTDAARERLEYELGVVRETGFTSYFLVVHEVARFARERGIAMGVRGSAAASVILYSLDVTDVDPLAYRLVFERFLNVERREMPDVDFDFADDRRAEVFQYAADKYGADHVAQIITFGTLGAKAAVRDVGRALGQSFGEADRIARLIPSAVGMSIERALKENRDLKAAYDAEESVRRLVDTAQRLEGVARHASTHAAGLVISREPLVENVPLQRPPRADADQDVTVPTTQFAMAQVAEIGLLKLDLLGLANLTILERAVALIKETRGVEIDLQTLPDGDEQTFAMLTAGETFGVFQLESPGMRRSIQDLKPTNVADLAAMVALYRPGPMQHINTFCRAKNGLQKIVYPHADLAAMLDETYGVITYQDQVLLIAQKFANYTLGEADVMRKAMGKKIPEVMHAEREHFVKGAKRNGYSEGEAQEIFELILPFAGYAFNKAHAVCYATIAYQTAYLKARYPAEYMVAVVALAGSHPAGGQSRIAAASAECAKLGIAVAPPSVNESRANFALASSANDEGDGDGKQTIRFGLQQIKNVGAAAAESIVAERDERGPFASIEDFCRRIDVKAVNKRALECLSKAGALDEFGARGTLLANIDRLVSVAQREQQMRESGQSTMFDLFGDEVTTPMPALQLDEMTVDRSEELAWEKELLGTYVSEHPFQAASAVLASHVTASCAELGGDANPANDDDDAGVQSLTADLPPKGRLATLAGMVGNTRRLYTKDGRPFCAAEIEDLTGMAEVTVWPELFEKTQDVWIEGNIVLLQVRIKDRNGRLDVAVQKVEQFQHANASADVDATPRFVPPAWLTKAKRAQQNGGNGSAGRSAVPANGGASAPHPSPTPAAEQATAQTPVASEAAVATATPATTAPRASAARAALRITLRETEDEDADRDRLERMLGTLRDYPGEDNVRLTIESLDGGTHSAVLAKVRVSVCDELTALLADVLSDAGEAKVIPQA